MTDIKQANNLQHLAGLMAKLGNMERADALYLECAELYNQLGSDYLLNAADALNELASLRQKRDDHTGALNAAQESARMMDTVSGGQPSAGEILTRLQAWALLGNSYRHLARYTLAEPILIRAVDYAIEHLGETDTETSMARNHLGILYKYTGEFDKAEILYRAALSHLMAEHGEESSLVAVIYHNLGGLAHSRGDFANGEADARKAWEINRRLLGEDAAVTLADAAAYAGVLDGLERYDESEPIYRHVLIEFEKIYGPEHYEITVNLNNLANVRYARGDFQEAELLFRRSLAIKEKTLGAHHPDTALTANNLGVLLHSLERNNEAKQLFQKALNIFREQLGDDHPKTRMVQGNLAKLPPN